MARQVVRETVTDTAAAPAVTPVSYRPQVFLIRLIQLVAGILILLLALRFLLSLLGANTTNGFANFIYTVSHPFVAPFFGLFNYNQIKYGVSRFEVYTLVAIVVYAIIAWILAALVSLTRR